jgi:2-polyprenyl-3-methyl-5-hydroxy-6-metoxy-1,4-benzoquinol methylase
MRNTKLCIYGSSYDRGLEHLLNIWGDVKKEVPDAELHIFYGWGLFHKFYADNPERMAWMEKMNQLMTQPGITHLGRISHEAVKQEMENAGIWAYPTHFGEISCITAMKAQAWGAVPIVINYAALVETVQFGIKIDGDIYDPETKETYKKALIEMLNHPEKQEEIRQVMMPWAQQRFTWANVAKQWSEEFKKVDLEKDIEDLLDHNQALKAYELAKGTEWESKIYPLVEHAFKPEVYTKYYTEQLIENAVDEDTALNCERLGARFQWLVPEIINKGHRKVIDLGCADGYLCLTLANKGLECLGINLYEPSVKLAIQRAENHKLFAKFFCQDFHTYEGEADAVVMFDILEHLPEPAKSLEKAYSMVSKGGSLYLATPRTDHIGVSEHIRNKYADTKHVKPWADAAPAGHLRLWTEAEFKELLKDYNVVQFMTDSEHEMLVEIQK